MYTVEYAFYMKFSSCSWYSTIQRSIINYLMRVYQRIPNLCGLLVLYVIHEMTSSLTAHCILGSGGCIEQDPMAHVPPMWKNKMSDLEDMSKSSLRGAS